ncbi:hypothetical protein AGLY_012979 [Aphis glycines]|uniref:Uncharacterized protein n=1 Tax=Aphis glycines TaxID=307491 RepID=A0A6G0T7D0_APHGL|nr:hypothetical protein AGLY_012979 [Aphis glycines]
MLTIIVVVDKSITCFQPLFHKQIYHPLDQNENDMSQMIHYQIINIDSSVMEHVIWIQVLEVMIVFFDDLPSIIIKIDSVLILCPICLSGRQIVMDTKPIILSKSDVILGEDSVLFHNVPSSPQFQKHILGHHKLILEEYNPQLTHHYVHSLSKHFHLVHKLIQQLLDLENVHVHHTSDYHKKNIFRTMVLLLDLKHRHSQKIALVIQIQSFIPQTQISKVAYCMKF